MPSPCEDLSRFVELYQVGANTQKYALQELETQPALSLRIGLVGQSEDEIRNHLRDAQEKMADFAVLSLWVLFERAIIEYLQKKSTHLGDHDPKDLCLTLSQSVSSDLERWRIDDVLDIFKSVLDSNLIGKIKQIKRYRDWVAHRNPRKAQPAKTTPEEAFRYLNAFLKELEQVDPDAFS